MRLRGHLSEMGSGRFATNSSIVLSVENQCLKYNDCGEGGIVHSPLAWSSGFPMSSPWGVFGQKA